MNLPSRLSGKKHFHGVHHAGDPANIIGVTEQRQNMAGPAIPSGIPSASTPSNGR